MQRRITVVVEVKDWVAAREPMRWGCWGRVLGEGLGGVGRGEERRRGGEEDGEREGERRRRKGGRRRQGEGTSKATDQQLTTNN